MAVLQGITEFLPVSSSGHLVLVQELFGLKEAVYFDVLVHLGTLGAVVFFFRHRILQVINRKIIFLIVVGSIPAGAAGIFLNNYLENIFGSLRLVGFLWAINGLLLLSTRFLPKGKRKISDLGAKDSFFVGLFQAFAILPGISRSGSTMAASLKKGLNPEDALFFSFLLAVPAVMGASLLQLSSLLILSSAEIYKSIVGIFVAGVVGYVSLLVLRKILVKKKLWLFSFYCFALSIFALIVT